MNEEAKSIWKKSWHGLGAFFILALSAAAVVFLVAFIYALTNWEKPVADTFTKAALAGFIFATCCLFAGCFVFLLRWMFWTHWRLGLFTLACLATLIALFYAEEDWRGWHAWNQFKHQWEAKGEKFDWQSIVPPPVPDDQNFALTPIVFTSYGQMLTRDGKLIPYKNRDTNFVNRLKMDIVHNYEDSPKDGNWEIAKISDLETWRNYYRALVAKTNEFPVQPQPQSPAADVLLALSKYDPAIEELRQVSQSPYSRFPLDYDTENPSEILLPHLATLKQCSLALQLRAIAELQNNQPGKALDDIKLALQLTDKIHTEPFLISHLVRIAMLQITLQPIYEGLAAHQCSEEQLVALDTELAKLDFLADYKLSMRGEMGLQGGNIDYLIRNRRELFNMTSENGTSSGPLFISSLIPTGWFYQNRFGCARMMVEFYIPLANVNQQTISPAAVRQADKALQAETKIITAYNILERMLLPGLGNVVKKFAYAQSSVNLARVAIALERYRLAHGEYPESLDALAPQFMERIPQDIIGGQPLHYRLTADGQFVLYSVGWNEKDDGGVVVDQKSRDPRDESGNPPDISQGDWVWRYPTK